MAAIKAVTTKTSQLIFSVDQTEGKVFMEIRKPIGQTPEGRPRFIDYGSDKKNIKKDSISCKLDTAELSVFAEAMKYLVQASVTRGNIEEGKKVFDNFCAFINSGKPSKNAQQQQPSGIAFFHSFDNKSTLITLNVFKTQSGNFALSIGAKAGDKQYRFATTDKTIWVDLAKQFEALSELSKTIQYTVERKRDKAQGKQTEQVVEETIVDEEFGMLEDDIAPAEPPKQLSLW